MSGELDPSRRNAPGRANRRLRTALIDGVRFSNRPVVYTDVDGWAMFEGDICLGYVDQLEASTDVKRATGRANAPLSDVISFEEARWPNGRIPYVIDPSLPNPKRVDDAIAHWQWWTLIRFHRRTDETDFVRFVPGEGCRSFIGRQGGEQTIELGDGCDAGRAIHEIFHAVGAWHEQSREDRDQFVRILWENIEPGEEHNFTQHVNDNDDVGAYDYGSIMHYERDAFSVNGMNTIEPLQPGVEIGQRVGLSYWDVEAVRAMYPDIGWGVKDPKAEHPKDGLKDEIDDAKPPSEDERKDAKFDVAYKEEPKEEYRDPATVLKDHERFGDLRVESSFEGQVGQAGAHPGSQPFVLAGGTGSKGPAARAGPAVGGLLPQLQQLLATFAELNYRGALDERGLAAWRMTTRAYLKLLRHAPRG